MLSGCFNFKALHELKDTEVKMHLPLNYLEFFIYHFGFYRDQSKLLDLAYYRCLIYQKIIVNEDKAIEEYKYIKHEFHNPVE
jgi:hypothetical protein